MEAARDDAGVRSLVMNGLRCCFRRWEDGGQIN